MFLDFITRDGQSVQLYGISTIRVKDQKEIFQYVGKIKEVDYTWDSNGRLSVNQRINYGSKHNLDLVDWFEESYKNPGVYYVEFKKEVMNGRQ